jgi:hypothetical protein
MTADAEGLAHRLPQPMVRRDGPDLTARQFGVLTVHVINRGPHTVHGLATEEDGPLVAA